MEYVDEAPFVEGSPIGILYARVTTGLLNRLAAKCELPVSMDILRKNLFFAPLHYDVGEMKERYPPKKRYFAANSRQFIERLAILSFH